MFNVTCEISTKDRYEFLAHALHSVAMQILPPKHVIVFDDGQFLDLRQHPLFAHIFKTFERKGISWEMLRGERKGQIRNHEKARHKAKTEWIWRLDDDNVAEPDLLLRLSKHASDPKVGAIAGVVLHPEMEFPPQATSPSIQDCLCKYAVQFSAFKGVQQVDHLYSTFVYRKEAAEHGYPLYLSEVGHREETIFTYEMVLNNWKLLVDGEAYTWHYRASSGGIRTVQTSRPWEQDEIKFQRKLSQWNIKCQEYFIAILAGGIGDHFSFKSLIPEIKAKYPNKKIILGVTYPDVFFDITDVEITSVHGGSIIAKQPLENFDIYRWGYENNWTGSLADAYRKMYKL